MGQIGTVGSKTIRAWRLGPAPATRSPINLAPADRHSGRCSLGRQTRRRQYDRNVQSAIPERYYFTLAGYTGYTNLIHIKPSVVVKPADRLSLMGAVGLQWRQTTADAIYVQPNNPVPGTAGRGGRWTGIYGQSPSRICRRSNLVGAIEAVHYEIAIPSAVPEGAIRTMSA